MAGHDRPDVETLIADLYLSAVDQEAAQRMPVTLARMVGGSVGALWSLDPLTNAVVEAPATNLPPEAVALYGQQFYTHDPFSKAVLVGRRDTAFPGEEIVGNAEYSRGIYYNEFAREHGMFHMIGALLTLGSEKRLGVVSILRPEKAERFESAAVEQLERILPHLRGALQLRAQLATARDAAWTERRRAVLDMLGKAALVVDGQCRVVEFNARAEAMPSIRAALSSRARSAELRVFDAATTRLLLAAVADAAAGGPGGTVVVRMNGTSHVATITPLPAGLAPFISAAGRPGKALVVLQPLERTDGDLTRTLAMTVFGFTTAEAETAMALAHGLSPAEIATARAVKLSTVRTLLKRAQDKAGCATLRDLVRIVTLATA